MRDILLVCVLVKKAISFFTIGNSQIFLQKIYLTFLPRNYNYKNTNRG